MRTDEIIERVNKLVVAYINKYERVPNAIVMCKNDFDLLFAYSESWLGRDAQPKDIHACYLMGMKLIPVKHGEMEVFELL